MSIETILNKCYIIGDWRKLHFIVLFGRQKFIL